MNGPGLSKNLTSRLKLFRTALSPSPVPQCNRLRGSRGFGLITHWPLLPTLTAMLAPDSGLWFFRYFLGFPTVPTTLIGMFGVGTYLATNSSKSDIYTEPNAAGERCILVVRACLGKPYRAKEYNRQLLKPPDRPDGRGPFSSVMGLTKDQEGVLEHPEFVIYDRWQSLPQYAIWYKHESACKCT